ncbi:putative membrane-associated peptidase [Xanthomonas oryzae pv. oryzicola BLS256]|uniref:Putative membrane-associated peptidase n=1 Tax=Xanthomonas oryzae pv. oryzicola (strain BLS256) TaxID=383407 RepID=G7TJN1_XANOB|nr:putative membrane-associated peptidase [Xanthomonas oryzae pv. oryzicola BLS256]
MWRPATHQGTRMESFYPQGPAMVPEQLTAPGSTYRRNA